MYFNKLLKKGRYDSCTLRPEYYYAKLWTKGMSSNCFKVRHIDVNKELCNYDINIVMSKYEGSSRILLESLYTGLICLSNNIPGTTGLSSKFSNSFFIEGNSIQEFKRYLDEIANSNIFFEDSANFNRELINQNYTSEKIAAAYSKIYQYLRQEIESYRSEFI